MRIFVGTEPCQARADRVLEYSIRKHTTTDVEFVWMRRGEEGWTDDLWPVQTFTGFTTFRCMVPYLLEPDELGIYLDTDILFLDDIAEFYSYGRHGNWITDSIGHTAMSIISGDLPNYQSQYDVCHGSLKTMHFITTPNPALNDWHCRGRLKPQHKAIHYTKVSMQPWRPYEHIKDLRYTDHPNKDLWLQYEAESLA